MQTFQQFDVDGLGIVDAQVMLDAVKKLTDAASIHSDLATVVRTLRSCTHTPGSLMTLHLYATVPTDESLHYAMF